MMNKKGDKEIKKQDMSKINRHFKSNLLHNNKTKHEIDYFIAGLDMERNRVASAETTETIHSEYSDVFTEIDASKAHFLSRSGIMQSHIK